MQKTKFEDVEVGLDQIAEACLVVFGKAITKVVKEDPYRYELLNPETIKWTSIQFVPFLSNQSAEPTVYHVRTREVVPRPISEETFGIHPRLVGRQRAACSVDLLDPNWNRIVEQLESSNPFLCDARYSTFYQAATEKIHRELKDLAPAPNHKRLISSHIEAVAEAGSVEKEAIITYDFFTKELQLWSTARL